MRYTVATFLVDRQYGGPEEGGWYYTAGEPVNEEGLPMYFLTNSLEKAQAAQARNQYWLDENANAGRRPISSVLSQGEYRSRICEGEPKPFPEYPPHYE